MSVHFCYRHPEIPARTRCFYCKQHICPDCLQHLGHHYFCSQRCHWLFQLHSAGRFLQQHRYRALLLWNGILTLGVLWLVIGGSSRNEPAPAASAPAEPLETAPASPDSSAAVVMPIDTLWRDYPKLRRALLVQRDYQLTLPLERGWVITVWRNDWPVLSEVSQTGGWQQFSIPLVYRENELRIGIWDNQQRLVCEDYLQLDYQNPLIEALRHSVQRGDPRQRRLSLTFDGGASSNGAREILAILAANELTTTLFLTGQFIENNPGLVQEMLEAGHEIANHTYNHPHLTTYEQNRRHHTAPGVDREFLQRQLLHTDSLFTALTGRALRPYWRAPYGEYNQEILDWAAEVGFRHIRWTHGFDTFDWVTDPGSPAFKTPREVYEAIIRKDNHAEDLNGAILLMHLGTERQSAPLYTILPELINDLQARGYQPVSVTKLLNP